MTVIVLHLASLSTKIVLLGGMAWTQLYLLRRAPASSRSRLCAMAMVAILLLATAEMLAPTWMVKTPVFNFTATASAQGASPAAARASADWWLAVLWMAGAGFMMARAIAGRAALAMVRRRFTLLQPALSLQETAGIEVRVADVQTPILVGLLRPTILLPEAARTWTDEQRRMVLIHEFTHFRQGDCWTNCWPVTPRRVLVSSRGVAAGVAAITGTRADLRRSGGGVRALPTRLCVVSAGCGTQSEVAGNVRLRHGRIGRTIPEAALRQPAGHHSSSRVDPQDRGVPGVVLSGRNDADRSSPGVVAERWQGLQGWRRSNAAEGPLEGRPRLQSGSRGRAHEGTVLLQLIVTAEGKAENIKVVKSLHPGLDQKAIEALSKWTFQPGTKDGKAVPVWATIEVNFRLR